MECAAVGILALSGVAIIAAMLALAFGRHIVSALDSAFSKWRRLGFLGRIVTAAMVVVATEEAQKGESEGVRSDGVEELGGGLPYSHTPTLTHSPNPTLTQSHTHSPTHYLTSAKTNTSYSYEMPANAMLYTNWWMRGGYEDVFRLDLGSWRFPLGTTSVSSLWVYTFGKTRWHLRDFSNEVAAIGAPMSAVPQVSQFWHMDGTNSSKILTWHNFFVGRIPISELDGSELDFSRVDRVDWGSEELKLGVEVEQRTNKLSSFQLGLETSTIISMVPISAQLELFPNGDYIARSNLVERYYKRINPDDFDDDGIPNDIDENPHMNDGDNFGPSPDLPDGANAGNYCWVDIVVNNANSLVTFVGDKPSNLPDPRFIAKAGTTHRVNLLIGKTYRVVSAQPIECTAMSDEAICVEQTSESSMRIVYPVSYEVVGAMRSVSRQIRMVPPITGTIQWDTNSCPCHAQTSGAGYDLPMCNGACSCYSCAPGGFTFHYEGYSLSFGGVECDCNPYANDVEDDGPYAASASVSFSKSAVIFEDEYMNTPTESVPRRSTSTTLTCTAHGGPNGGRAIFTLGNAGKLICKSGVTLPIEVDVPAGHKVSFEIVYEGAHPSESENDVVATAQFVDNEDGELGTMESELTSIEVKLEAVFVAPENSRQDRHVYGVGEKVNFLITPILPTMTLNVDRTDKGDSWTQYDTFAGETEVSASSGLVYRCPASGGSPDIMVSFNEVSYSPIMLVLEPCFVLTPEAVSSGTFSLGEVGMGRLTTKNYIGPMEVSFQGVRFFEVPCKDVISPIGYYATTNYTGLLSHVQEAGAGYLHTLKEGNYWTIDEAGRDAPYQNWSAGKLEWKVPIGWRRFRSDDEKYGIGEYADYERHNDKASRPLLIGNRNDMYKQTFAIESDGTASVSKFGYKLSRSRWWLKGTVEKERKEQ